MSMLLLLLLAVKLVQTLAVKLFRLLASLVLPLARPLLQALHLLATLTLAFIALV